jgi:hypothetical protein
MSLELWDHHNEEHENNSPMRLRKTVSPAQLASLRRRTGSVGEKVLGLSVDDRILVDNAIMHTGLPAQLLEQSKPCVNWAGTHAGGIDNPLSGVLPVSLLPPSVRPTQPSPMVPEPQSAAVGPNGSSSRRQLA